MEAGWDIAYRPYNYPGLREVGADFPTEANYLIHGALEVAGNPNALSQTVAASQDYLTGVIEGVEQAGMAQLAGKVPVARTFGINQDWLNTLEPEVVVGKYVLATNERGARLLYVRPYTEETVGDMVQNTEQLVRGLRTSLEAEGYSVGEVERLEYDTVPLLRALSAVGIVAGLVLLALMYPGVWGRRRFGGGAVAGHPRGRLGLGRARPRRRARLSGARLRAFTRETDELRARHASFFSGRGAPSSGGQ